MAGCHCRIDDRGRVSIYAPCNSGVRRLLAQCSADPAFGGVRLPCCQASEAQSAEWTRSAGDCGLPAQFRSRGAYSLDNMAATPSCCANAWGVHAVVRSVRVVENPDERGVARRHFAHSRREKRTQRPKKWRCPIVGAIHLMAESPTGRRPPWGCNGPTSTRNPRGRGGLDGKKRSRRRKIDTNPIHDLDRHLPSEGELNHERKN